MTNAPAVLSADSVAGIFSSAAFIAPITLPRDSITACFSPAVEAALVKALGNDFEKELPEIARLAAPHAAFDHRFRATLSQTLLHMPAFTIRGGTREILRGVIARGLGLR